MKQALQFAHKFPLETISMIDKGLQNVSIFIQVMYLRGTSAFFLKKAEKVFSIQSCSKLFSSKQMDLILTCTFPNIDG